MMVNGNKQQNRNFHSPHQWQHSIPSSAVRQKAFSDSPMITGLYSTLLGDICTNVKVTVIWDTKGLQNTDSHYQIITISILQDSLSHNGIKFDGSSQICTTITDYCLQ